MTTLYAREPKVRGLWAAGALAVLVLYAGPVPLVRPARGQAPSDGGGGYAGLLLEARTKLDAGRPSEAVELATKAVRLDRGRFEAYSVRALALMQEGRYEQAADDAEVALSKAPEARRAVVQRLLEDIQTQRRNGPSTRAEGSQPTSSSRPIASSRPASTSRALDPFTCSVGIPLAPIPWGEIEKLPPDQQWVALRTAATVALTGAHDTVSCERAVEVHLRLVAFLESNPSQSDWSSRQVVYNNLATMLVDSVSPPQLEKAEFYARKLMVRDPMNRVCDPRVADTVGWVLVRNAQSDSAKFDEGIKLLAEAARYDSLRDEALYHLGAAYQMDRQYGRAEEYYQAALRTLKDRPNADEPLRQKIEDALARLQRRLGMTTTRPAATQAWAP